MVRRSLIAAAALLAVASPLTAQTPTSGQEAWTWSSDRPDANASLGVFGARTFEEGEFELTYNFEQMNTRGVWFGTDSLALATTLQLFDDAPLQSSDIRHQVRAGFGVSDRLTLVARGEFAVIERETNANGGLIRTSVEELGDLEVGALVNIYDVGPYRLHLQGGAIIPIGEDNTTADTTAAQTGAQVALPFDMRPGAGTFGIVGAITGNVQNEVGSLGAQFRIRLNVGENDVTTGYTLGDEYEANGWAAYNITQHFSVSGGARWQNWDNIDGADTRLKVGGDPHNQGGMLAGQRVTLPVGLTLVLPEGPLQGHRLSLEAVYAIHHDYEGPQLGLDWGVNVGYTLDF